MRTHAISVPAWQPALHISDKAVVGDSLAIFAHELPRGYEAPEIYYEQFGEAIVTGVFTVNSGLHGPVKDSFYMWPSGTQWDDTIAAGYKLTRFENEQPALVIGNVSSNNYYHWTFQCLASLMLYPKLSPSEDFIAVMPVLNRWQLETLAILDLDFRRLEMDMLDIIHFSEVVRSDITGGGFAWAPHPLVTSEFEHLATTIGPARRFGKKIYASRLDAPDVRRLVNEAELCQIMVAHGFEIVTPGRLSVEEQIIAFRDAEVVVGLHGAGLTNLLYCKQGATRVVELLASASVNTCYAKICQAKGLNYTAIINADIIPANAGLKPLTSLNDTLWEADLQLVESIIARL